MEGIVISPMKSQNNIILLLINLYTAFDFLRSPSLYEPEKSLISSLIKILTV